MTQTYTADDKRYETMEYNRCGTSGIKLPIISLGFWHNFGVHNDFDNMRRMCFTAFDEGITHFDLADNYGPYPGSAEDVYKRQVQANAIWARDCPRSFAISFSASI